MGTQRDDPNLGVEETRAVDADAMTLSDEEWPVAREYRVTPTDEAVHGNGDIEAAPTETAPYRRADEAGELVVTPPPAPRRLPPAVGFGLLGALLAMLLVAGAGAAWLASRDESGVRTAQTQPGPGESTAPATTNDASPAAAVTVPDVLGFDLAHARSALEQAELRVRTRRVPSEGAANEVLEQEPRPGTDVDPRSTVVLTVSAGPQRIEVPAVLGLTASEARRALREADLRYRIRLVSSTEPAGTILAQDPPASTDVEPRSLVRLDVARASLIAVPRLVGSIASEARVRLRELGLRFALTRVESSKPLGTVLRQSPSAGSRVRKGEGVTLTISSGPADVTVPDVVGLDEQSARSQLEGAGFSVQVVDEPTSDAGQDGMVTNQAPAGGDKTKKAGVVTLTVARFS